MDAKNSIPPPHAGAAPFDKGSQRERALQAMALILAPAPGYARRMKVYFKEMFPLGRRLSFATLFYFAFVLLLARIHGQRLAVFSFWNIVGIWDIFALLLILRLMDELKDRRTDLELFRERPLPSGRVLPPDISFSLAVAIILYLAANSWAGPGFWTAAGVLAYAFLMFRYFFMPRILRRHLLLNLATHNPITAWLLIHTVCLFSLQAGLPLRAIRWKPALLLIAMNWAMVFAWEISRKIRSAVEENAYVTYSQIFGREGAVALAGGAQTLAFALAVCFFRQLRLSWLAVAVLVVGYGATLAGHLRFLARPSPLTSRLKPFAEGFVASLCLAVITDALIFPVR